MREMFNGQCSMSKGFTLLEIIAATFVLLLMAGGVFSLVVFNLRASSGVARHTEAAYLAQEGIELVRNMRDTNFLAIRRGLCNPIANPDAWKGVGSCGGAIINLTSCGGGCQAQYNSSSLISYAGALLLRDNNGMYNYSTGGQTPFRRKITINDSEPDILRVDVEVFWEAQSVVASTELYNWLTLAPPIRSNGSPSGTLPAGTPTALLQLATNQSATCRYSENPGIRYDDTANNIDFTTTGGTSHSHTVPVSDGESYTFYVRCSGQFYNTNVSDFEISFTVASP
ncbi:MAG: hypothetical protein A3J30_02080 [Candidatus Wildermuthbacteria bacterium RIFCSPLOWO2_02_FULL_47_9c]|uniref:Prepilin-type N-terminal cleavage/methylation domain-containing protein n=2 Tax=Parcubacteria group TaxID=1794811 RepID=A0A1G2RW78_9BACT|nr:MAG: hypothetical protein A3J30_02080 [Candidatus Wildermuthbacteria bacterium RIFCSPLOWO2_02_FULL_47_9c]OHA78334.1 MAG: hypothetical protein A2564_03730 [Candidatus Wildermuthbacteria bacterium RIFOXYD1_FULL_50_12]